ncbi:tRNA glutamyl-Q(34) synthetase GluQRS [Vibrio ostreicida]|uniref:tRNA glutamyl-Q(34) synthetase GluQRS n=1 Tax=Vibrio ostreicida TaxID=526588 RepID=UPI003B59D1BE
MHYIGRFAPSPSGPLHFGSLIAALGSYFQAKSQHGKWLVRIEDIDPPREMQNASTLILQTLEAYHLHWDGEVMFQSRRQAIYQAQIEEWIATQQAYYCQCTRKKIKAMGGFYTGACRTLELNNLSECAVRLKMTEPVYQFNDQKHGHLTIPSQLADEDFIIKRRDGLYAYNLAVVLDDIEQGITEVVRGADLIEPTGRQLSLYKILGKPPIRYLHLPLAIGKDGHKLSKQNHAPALDNNEPIPALIEAMRCLGFEISKEIERANIEEIIEWGVENWCVELLTGATKVTPRFSNCSL